MGVRRAALPFVETNLAPTAKETSTQSCGFPADERLYVSTAGRRLRQIIAADIGPVKPLPPPSSRVLWALPIAALLMAASVVYFGLRSDSSSLGWGLTWASSAFQLALGIALLGMVLREAVPGMRLPHSVIFGVGSFALILLLAVYVVSWLRSPMDPPGSFAAQWACLRGEFLLGVPLLFTITYLAARALPARPSTVGLIAGLGSGIIADASWRLVCPLSAPLHFLTAHLGGILALGSAGFLIGWLRERLYVRPRRRSPELIETEE